MDDGAAVAALDLGGKAFHIVAGAHLVVHHHAGHKDGVFVHMLQHPVHVQCAVRAGFDHRDIIALLRQLFQRALDAGVLKAGHHDALADHIRHLGSNHRGGGVIQIMQFRVLQHKRDSCFLKFQNKP